MKTDEQITDTIDSDRSWNFPLAFTEDHVIFFRVAYE
jgi:hypothetical protein